MNNENLKFEHLTEEYIPYLVELEKIIFSDAWSYGMFANELESEFSNFFVLKNEKDEIIAYFGLWIVQDEGHINNFAVIPDYRSLGIANKLMEEIFNIGNEYNVSMYFLEVRKSNSPAINLYKKYGFCEIGVRKLYYRNPREDALLMMKLI